MSRASLLNIHTVEVLRPRITQSRSGASKRDYSSVFATLKCRVIPLSATDVLEMKLKSSEITHELRFAFDPKLQMEDRLHWVERDTVMRVVLPWEPHGVGLEWVVHAVAYRQDNQEREEFE